MVATAPRSTVFAERDPDAATREFVTVGSRQLHLRFAGSGPPVIVVSPLPYSSAVLGPLIERLAGNYSVFAPDTAGYGASDPLASHAPVLADYAGDLLALADELALERFALVGYQFGALIALAVSVAAPARVESLVLRELPLLDPALRAELAERYVPHITPRLDGSHLLEHWLARRDEHIFFPWYEQKAANRLAVDLSAPDTLERRIHQGVLDQMLAGERWGSGYRAMFDTDVPALLSSVVVSTRVIETPNDLIARLDDDLPAGAARFETIARQDDERSAVAAALAATGPRPLAPARPRALDGAITRTYARTPFGQLLARCAGALSAAPLLMLHPSPGSGARLEPLITALASTRRVVALDTLGNGDSDKPVALATPTIADYAVVFEAAADALGLETFDLYGSHTGAIMALEVALRMGGRVRSLILDGITLFSEQENAKFLDGYFVDLTPAWDGTHLIRAWSTVRDGRLWFPWHDRRPEAIAPFDLLDASGAQAYTLEMLKSGATYSLAYQAVFTHPTAERLALLETRTLVCHPPGDPLARFSEPAAALAPNATACALPSAQPDRVAEVLVAFLDESRPASI